MKKRSERTETAVMPCQMERCCSDLACQLWLIHAQYYESDGCISCQIRDGDFDRSPELKKTGFHSQAFMFIKFESGNARKKKGLKMGLKPSLQGHADAASGDGAASTIPNHVRDRPLRRAEDK